MSDLGDIESGGLVASDVSMSSTSSDDDLECDEDSEEDDDEEDGVIGIEEEMDEVPDSVSLKDT